MTHELLIHLATWNVADQGPPPVGRLQLNKLIQLDSPTPADVCAIGLQEVRKSSDWGNQLAKEVAKSDYVLVRSIQMQGIVLYTYVLRKHLPFVTNVETQYTRTALNGLLGLKGAVSFRADLYGVNIAIVNCHLCAYDEKFAERIENYNVIIEGQTFKDKYVENILDHDYVFWIGDLNFRIDDITREEVIERTEKGDYRTLLLNDQLCKARKEELIFVDFEEGPISFPPTYKFDVGSNTYDSGPKCRKPAWCDRILYMVHEDAFMELNTLQLLTTQGRIDPRLHVQQLVYTSIMDFQTSDHKPVISQCTIKVFTVVPSVVFDDLQGWQCGNEATVKYHVIGMPTSTWDYLALFKADFFTLDEYVTYVYATGKNEGTVGATVSIQTAKFPASALRDPGPYRICYISAGKKFIRGMSNVFEVQPKYVLAPLPPIADEVPKAVVASSAVDQQQQQLPLAVAEDAAAVIGTDVADVFADASAPPAVQEFPVRAWGPPDGTLPAAVIESAPGESDGQQASSMQQGIQTVVVTAAAAGAGSSSRLHPGMSIQELKLVSAELRQEQRRKQSAMSLLLAKASKLSARLTGIGLPLGSPPQIVEEECPCTLSASSPPLPSAAAVAAAATLDSTDPASARPSAVAVAAIGNPAAVGVAVEEETVAKEAGGGSRGLTNASVLYSSDTASYMTALDLDLLTALSKRQLMPADSSKASMIAMPAPAPTSVAGAAGAHTATATDFDAADTSTSEFSNSNGLHMLKEAAAGTCDDLRSPAATEGVTRACAAGAVSADLSSSAAGAAPAAGFGQSEVGTATTLSVGPGVCVGLKAAGGVGTSGALPNSAEVVEGAGRARHVTLPPAAVMGGTAGQAALPVAAPWHSQESAEGVLSVAGSNESSDSSRASSVSPPLATVETQTAKPELPPKSDAASPSVDEHKKAK